MEQKRIPLSNQEIIEKLKSNISKIEFFSDIFDSGKIDIYEDIAVKLRVLLHSTNSSKSLIRLAKLEHINFVDTSHKFDPKNLVSHTGLIAMNSTNNIWEYRAFKHLNGHRDVLFDNWWDGKKVLSDKFNHTFTRKDLICKVANTDGGAHVDPSIHKDYNEVSRNNSLDWFIIDHSIDTRTPLNNPIPPCIRQIAYEVIKTFQNINIEKSTKLYLKN